MPARFQPSTSNDAFSFHAGPVLVQPVMARTYLRIEPLEPRVSLVTWLAIELSRHMFSHQEIM